MATAASPCRGRPTVHRAWAREVLPPRRPRRLDGFAPQGGEVVSRPCTPREAPADALAYSLDQAASRLGIGKTMLEELVAAGQITSMKIGRRRLVSRAALEAFIARQERKAA